MYCYRCNGTLDLKKDACSKCGTDVRMFKKIVYASNRKYNEALVKAESRNLSGAMEDLKASLHLYKKNIQARNLLGLVYYAMGESAEALREWNLARQISSAPGQADRFLNAIRKNMRELNSEANGLRRFNQALGYAKNNAKDLAVIQLKKLISVNQNMTKAYNLLALLYMEDGKFPQAEKVLLKCLEVDRGNDTAIRFLKSIRGIDESDEAKSLGTVGTADREQLIIPVRFRDYGTYLSNALYIVLGLVLGVLIAWFVIVPGRVERETEELDSANRSYEQKISELQSKLAAEGSESEEETLDDQESEEDSTDAEEPIEVMPVLEKNTRWSINQQDVGNAVVDINATPPRYADVITEIMRVDQSQLGLENQTHYRNVMTILFTEAVYQRIQAMAINFEATGDIDQAAYYYDALSLLHPESAEFRLNAGRMYESKGDVRTAANRYWCTAVLFPETESGETAANKYLSLTGRESVPPYTGEIPLESFKTPLSLEEILSKIGGTE